LLEACASSAEASTEFNEELKALQALQLDLLAELDTADSYQEYFNLELDLVFTDLLLDDTYSAMHRLYQITTWAPEDDAAIARNWQCKIANRQDLHHGAITLREYFELVNDCENFTIINSFSFGDTLSLSVTGQTGSTQKNGETANGIGNLNKTKDFKVIPNPSSGQIKIESKSIKAVEIVGLLGNMVFNADYNGLDLINIDLSGIPKGIYFVRVSDGTTTGIKKIVLQ
jgi:hypothetical protein